MSKSWQKKSIGAAVFFALAAIAAATFNSGTDIGKFCAHEPSDETFNSCCEGGCAQLHSKGKPPGWDPHTDPGWKACMDKCQAEEPNYPPVAEDPEPPVTENPEEPAVPEDGP